VRFPADEDEAQPAKLSFVLLASETLFQANFKTFKIANYVKYLMATLILATLGFHGQIGSSSKVMRVVDDTIGALMTYAIVEVCYNSLKKLCTRIKTNILKTSESSFK
jgi:hypothetical protein